MIINTASGLLGTAEVTAAFSVVILLDGQQEEHTVCKDFFANYHLTQINWQSDHYMVVCMCRLE